MTTTTIRPIHYLGSKLRLADAISAYAASLRCNDGAIVDVFSGSGTMSRAFADRGPVLSVDIQEYSRVLASALGATSEVLARVFAILSESVAEMETSHLVRATQSMAQIERRRIAAAVKGDITPIADMIEAGPLLEQPDAEHPKDPELLLARTEARSALTAQSRDADTFPTISALYGGLYLSYEQAASADTVRRVINQSFKGVSRDVALAILCSALSELVNTVGKHFAQPLSLRTRDGRAKPQLVEKLRRDRTRPFKEALTRSLELFKALGAAKHRIVAAREDYAVFLNGLREQASVVYADPPYTRDHYSRYYHVLETVCRDDVPLLTRTNLNGGTRVSKGAYRADRHQSPFCIRSQAPAAFEALFRSTAKLECPLLLSYSPFDSSAGAHPRMMSVEAISDLAAGYFRDVSTVSVGPFSHAKLNTKRLQLAASNEAEVLLVCRND